MAYARIEPTGCGEFHGNVKVRLSFFLEPDDARYDARHYLVPVIPESGYPGKVDKEGNPLDLEEYKLWEASLPKKWVLAPFHNHFLYLPPDVTEDVIVAKADLHLPNFYAAWLQELDKIPGGMRKGWALEERKRPTRYDRTDPELYAVRKPQCLDKIALIKRLPLAIRSDKRGEIFPSTEIDIGAAAIDRSSKKPSFVPSDDTCINVENPANEDGTIDEVEIYAYSNLSGCNAATCVHEGSNYLYSRDYEAIGSVTAGSKQTFSSLDIDVVTGDYLGVDWDDGQIEADTSGGDGVWEATSDIIPFGSTFIQLDTGETASLYGTGETAAGAQTISSAGGIATVEGVGGLQVNLNLAPSGVSSVEGIGSPVAAGPIIASGIASVQGLGSPQLNLKVEPSGLASVEGVGSPVVRAGIVCVGIATVEGVGSPVVAGSIIASGIASVEGLGSPQLNLWLHPDGVPSVQGVGSPQVNIWVHPSGVASVEGLGSHQINLWIHPSSVTSVEGLGALKLLLYLLPSGIATVEGIGSPQVNLWVHPGGVGSVEGLGSPQLNFTLYPSGIASVAGVGSPDIILIIYPSGALGYIIEVRDSSGNLLAFLEHAHGITLVEQLNRPPMMDFNLPTDDSKISHIDPDNEVWLRDYETGLLIKKFLISRRRDTRG